MTSRFIFRTLALTLGALVSLATPALADGPRGDRQDRRNHNDRQDRRDSDRGAKYHGQPSRGQGQYRQERGYQVGVDRAWPAPVVQNYQNVGGFGGRGYGSRWNRVQTGTLVVINPFSFPVRVIVNGQALGRVGALDRMRIPGVVAGAAVVTLKSHRQVLASENVFVQARGRTRWSPQVRHAGWFGSRW